MSRRPPRKKIRLKTPAQRDWARLSIAAKQARLRAAITPAETKLIEMLDSHPSTANRYIHQASICGYFPDFSFAHCRLIVELDGACHRGRLAKIADARRTAKLRSKGWRVIRFWNSELRSPAVVMKTILLAVRHDETE